MQRLKPINKTKNTKQKLNPMPPTLRDKHRYLLLKLIFDTELIPDKIKISREIQNSVLIFLGVKNFAEANLFFIETPVFNERYCFAK